MPLKAWAIREGISPKVARDAARRGSLKAVVIVKVEKQKVRRYYIREDWKVKK